jgi:Ca-activated chloride channel homolog
MSFSALELARPMALLLLIAVPLILWVARHHRRRAAVLKLPGRALVEAVRPTLVQRLRWLPVALRALAVMLVAVGLARPQARTTEIEDLTYEGIDIMIVFDVSGSMRAVDFKPNDRLHVAKEVTAEFVSRRPNDRIGFAIFAGEAYALAPLTRDHTSLKEIIMGVEYGHIEDGTAIGNGIATALLRLRESDAETRVIVLITDGDNNAGQIAPMQAAAMAKQLGVPIHTILVGDGGAVPFPVGRDMWGRPVYRDVVIPVDPALLEAMSGMTGGRSWVATDRRGLERDFQALLDELDRTEVSDELVQVRYVELFPLVVLPAVLLVLLELLLAATRFRTFP